MISTLRPPLPTTGFFTTMSPDYGEGSGEEDGLASGDGDYHFSGKKCQKLMVKY